jgi:hypothetical protein
MKEVRPGFCGRFRGDFDKALVRFGSDCGTAGLVRHLFFSSFLVLCGEDGPRRASPLPEECALSEEFRTPPASDLS